MFRPSFFSLAQILGGTSLSSENKEFVQQVADKNVEIALENVTNKSPVLVEMLEAGEIDLVGGMYSVETGHVEFN